MNAHDPDRSIHAFSPAGVGNIGVGFDLLGHSIDGLREFASVRRIAAPEVRIDAISGDIARLDSIPRDALHNTAGRGVHALRKGLGLEHGFAITLDKRIALGAGLGGSAASCVAALVAANALLDAPLTREALYPYAMEGEAASTGTLQGDNVGAMLLGGVVLATSHQLLRLDAPDWLHCVVTQPRQVLETRSAREVLQAPYPLAQVTTYGAHLALFLTGLQRGDAGLIRAGLQDDLVEPRRAALVPGFADVKAAAMAHGALGSSLSGAGPSVFAWFDSRSAADAAAPAMAGAFIAIGVPACSHVSRVAGPRADIIQAD